MSKHAWSALTLMQCNAVKIIPRGSPVEVPHSHEVSLHRLEDGGRAGKLGDLPMHVNAQQVSMKHSTGVNDAQRSLACLWFVTPLKSRAFVGRPSISDEP